MYEASTNFYFSKKLDNISTPIKNIEIASHKANYILVKTHSVENNDLILNDHQ
mgnify:FL=1